MANLLARPEHLANRAVKFDDFIGGLGASQPPRISIKDDRFTLLDETGMSVATPSLEIKVIIVGVNRNASRIYYDRSKPYDGEGTAPLCLSDNGVGPSTSCSTPQAPTCASCEFSKWGSAVSQMTGKPIPACSTIKKLAVLVSGVDGMFLLSVPPASLGNYKQYISSLAKIPASPEELVTKVTINNKELQFEYTDWTPADYMEYITEIIANDDTASIVNKHDKAIDHTAFTPKEPTYQITHSQAPTYEPTAPSLYPQTPPPPAITPPAVRRPGRPPGVKNKVEAPPVYKAPEPTPTLGTTPQFEPPQGFGFGLEQSPRQPDPGVQSMLDNAFKLPRRT